MAIGPKVLSPGHARRSRICQASRATRRAAARDRVRRSLGEIDVPRWEDCQHLINVNRCNEFPQGRIALDVDNESILSQSYVGIEVEDNLEANNGDVLEEPVIVSREGDYSKVETLCLSITYLYSETTSLMHISMLSLSHEKCILHNIGNLDFACSFCGALAWKTEAKTIRTFVGKSCCNSGNVSLPPLSEPPLELRELMHGGNTRSRKFLKHIRAYNSVLAFASLGAHIDESLCQRKGIYTFKVHGSIYHNIGPLMPEERSGQIPRFAQLYFFDTENELQNRMSHVSKLKPDVLESLQSMMHRVNPYVQAFRGFATMVQTSNIPEIRMVITEKRTNGWQYVAPTSVEVAAIMPGQGEESNIGHRDIVLNLLGGGLKRISNCHRSYMPLLYVLLFPNGEEGWNPYIPQVNRAEVSRERVNGTTKYISTMDFYKYRLQIRDDTTQCLLRGGRLLQQYIVDAYSCMEELRLLWVRNHQSELRSEVYQGLTDMVGARDGTRDDRELLLGANVGRRVVLPSSYVGGPRYMHQLYQDAMAIVRKRGKPDLFITFTCNPGWKEIQDALLPGQTSNDRPDLTARVFYHKFKDLMGLLIKRAIFGKVIGHISVIEFQKRGLPHAHILLILASEHKPTETLHYDKIVCAELPDKVMFPQLYDVISRCNVHGPCGNLNKNAPCMKDGKCRFKYPRSFSASTTVARDGYPTYMRRDDGNYTVRNKVQMSNKWIVPYNPFLSIRYNAHINVEVCSTISAVKYLYKYVYKGHDRATVVLQDSEGLLNEVTNYLNARYVSASEAIWRILGFHMHQEKPDIQRLQVHLPHQNQVIFSETERLYRVWWRERSAKRQRSLSGLLQINNIQRPTICCT